MAAKKRSLKKGKKLSGAKTTLARMRMLRRVETKRAAPGSPASPPNE